MFDGVTGHGFNEFLAQVHVPLEVAKSHFGFDHPKFSGMTRSIGIFGAKGWTKGVDVGKRAGKSFPFQLAADRQVSRLAKKVRLRLLVNVPLEGRDAEHLACSLAIAGGDDRGVNVDKVTFLKELVDGKRQLAAQAKDSSVKI